jgi:hypothetical protein
MPKRGVQMQSKKEGLEHALSHEQRQEKGTKARSLMDAPGFDGWSDCGEHNKEFEKIA